MPNIILTSAAEALLGQQTLADIRNFLNLINRDEIDQPNGVPVLDADGNLKVLQDTHTNLTNVVPGSGVFAYATDTKGVYIGDGVSTISQLSSLTSADAVIQSDLDAHKSDVANPHSVTKAQVGLGNADNTSDVNKPVSTAQQSALNLKVDESTRNQPNGFAGLNGQGEIGGIIAHRHDTFANISSTVLAQGEIAKATDTGLWYEGDGSTVGGNQFIPTPVWDDSNNGISVFGGLIGSTASGDYSIASGRSSTASSRASTASGFYSIASGKYSIASGRDSEASGDYSIASGGLSTASGQYSIASGYGSIASGFDSIASGIFSTASGIFSTASGMYSEASGAYSTASGRHSTASGRYSSASGRYTQVHTDNVNENGLWSSSTTRGGSTRIHGNGVVASTIINSSSALDNTDVIATVTALSRSSNVVTATAAGHNLVVGQTVNISGTTPTSFNDSTAKITAKTASTFTYANVGNDESATVMPTVEYKLGAELDGQLAEGMFAFRRNGSAVFIDLNIGGTIQTLPLGTAS